MTILDRSQQYYTAMFLLTMLRLWYDVHEFQAFIRVREYVEKYNCQIGVEKYSSKTDFNFRFV